VTMKRPRDAKAQATSRPWHSRRKLIRDGIFLGFGILTIGMLTTAVSFGFGQTWPGQVFLEAVAIASVAAASIGTVYVLRAVVVVANAWASAADNEY
jgi:hypothetical protein